MLDYERRGQDWNKMVRSSATDWKRNVETIVQWSPFSSEADLLRQCLVAMISSGMDNGLEQIIWHYCYSLLTVKPSLMLTTFSTYSLFSLFFINATATLPLHLCLFFLQPPDLFANSNRVTPKFNQMQDRGTRIIIYNLWEDDQGLLELDFDTDPHDIQIRGVNRDQKNIDMAKKHPNSKHFLTYRHSLRNFMVTIFVHRWWIMVKHMRLQDQLHAVIDLSDLFVSIDGFRNSFESGGKCGCLKGLEDGSFALSYAAILYLRVPPSFRIILRGEDVEHHNIVNDMMMSQEVTYRPQPGADGIPKDSNIVAVVTVGFVKDAEAHIDVQGFNVYHKNRLIKWSVLECVTHVYHFCMSSHFGEFGILLVAMVCLKQTLSNQHMISKVNFYCLLSFAFVRYTNCHKIGYAPRSKKAHERETSPDSFAQSPLKKKSIASNVNTRTKFADKGNNYGHLNGKGDARKRRNRPSYAEESSSSEEDVRNNGRQNQTPTKKTNGSSAKIIYGKDGLPKSSGLSSSEAAQNDSPARTTRNSNSQKVFPVLIEVKFYIVSGRSEIGYNNNEFSPSSSSSHALAQLKEENLKLRERLKRKEEEILGELLHDLQKEKERSKSLEAQLKEVTRKLVEQSKEQESLIDIFSEERQRRDIEEETLRKKLKEASNTIQELLDKEQLNLADAPEAPISSPR
ncbi:hypothetical protein PHJA_002196200 [Phtheirospermum japonicum]|uniref:Morc S5 domain-containing protein n=1 Tax=Phtheirospermum japonicum TaxID=374723 RepID=A0A830CQP5_9LAMI|nr:hypothetical protein PHJA_002196200 [Phtheirospermum japonicum]